MAMLDDQRRSYDRSSSRHPLPHARLVAGHDTAARDLANACHTTADAKGILVANTSVLAVCLHDGVLTTSSLSHGGTHPMTSVMHGHVKSHQR